MDENWRAYFDLMDWENLLNKIKNGDPEANKFSDKMIQEKQLSAKMLKKYYQYAVPLACFWLKVKKIWYTNNFIKIKWVSTTFVGLYPRN